MERSPYLRDRLESIDVKSRKLSEILREISKTAYQGRKLGEVYEILLKMFEDPKITVFMGLAGSMGPGGMWKIVKWFVDEGFIDVLVSTGANISEDIVEAMGFSYYRGSPCVDDYELLKHKIDRFYDVYVSELDYRVMENLIVEFVKTIPEGIYSTPEFLYLFGRFLNGRGIESIVTSAYRSGVPIFSPALVDSGYGVAAVLALREGRRVVLDMVKDFDQLVKIAEKSEESAVIYVGGGVPKDTINLVTVVQTLLAERRGSHDYYKPHKFAVQITTDLPQWGGLSGATLEEAVSWGKTSPWGLKATVHVDATIALPLIAHALAEEVVTRRPKKKLIELLLPELGR
ncbi:MAG: deoxyhypusine synthase [Sulfolobales archaeon]|nr:deoxyhypusine synthase [Sulfolobales archaeon]MDW8082852.1 deoxyhypusine synthase [Sulfolobales archaeon]